MDDLGVVMSAEFQKVDYKRQAAQKRWQLVFFQTTSDGCTSIGANWLDPIVLANQEEGNFAAVMNAGQQAHGLVADVSIPMKAHKAKQCRTARGIGNQ